MYFDHISLLPLPQLIFDLPPSQLHVLFFYNPLNPICAVHILMTIGLSSGE